MSKYYLNLYARCALCLIFAVAGVVFFFFVSFLLGEGAPFCGLRHFFKQLTFASLKPGMIGSLIADVSFEMHLFQVRYLPISLIAYKNIFKL